VRIALVHSFYSSSVPSGENIVVQAQAEALADAGIEVALVAARTDDRKSVPGYKLRSAVNVAIGSGRSPFDELQRFEPDVVHVHNLFPNWGSNWLEKWTGPLVATIHNFRAVCAAGTLFRDGHVCTLCPTAGSINAVVHACYRDSRLATIPLAIKTRSGVSGDAVLNRADRVVMLSERVRGSYEGFGLPAEKIRLVPNYVDDVGYKPDVIPGGHWAYIGRLAPEKGLINLLSNWPRGSKLRIYGDGPLRSFVESQQSADVIYGGQLHNSEVPRALEASRGLIFPSEWFEGAPLIYVESLAAGRAVVALEGNGVADDIKKFGGGLTFASWADFTGALASADELATILGGQARAQYEQRFTKSSWSSTMITLYNELLLEKP
jgi:glycosyltransferase involved in cell wall biosynthesis